MLTIKEVEMLAGLLARAGVNPYEADWANSVLQRLRAGAEAPPVLNTEGNDDNKPTDQSRS